METLKVIVRGSKGNPYQVTFAKSEAEMRAYCRCTGGVKGAYCSHRLALLNGDGSQLASGYEASLGTVQAWLPGTELEVVLRRYNAAKQALEHSKTEANRLEWRAAKEDLARVMLGKRKIPRG